MSTEKRKRKTKIWCIFLFRPDTVNRAHASMSCGLSSSTTALPMLLLLKRSWAFIFNWRGDKMGKFSIVSNDANFIIVSAKYQFCLLAGLIGTKAGYWTCFFLQQLTGFYKLRKIKKYECAHCCIEFLLKGAQDLLMWDRFKSSKYSSLTNDLFEGQR